MTIIKTRIVFLSAALVATASWLGACASQPNAGCPVSTSNPAFGLPPYWVKYDRISASGACGDLKGEGIGFQKYNTPGTKEIRLGYAIEGLGGPYSEGRVDPADPEGKNINGFSKLPPVPNAEGYCEVTEFRGAPRDGGSLDAPQQNFEEIPDSPLADGGVEAGMPALSRKYEFQKLKFLATVNAPGTLFTGELKLTENTCTATFKTTGLWPQIHCDPKLNEPNGYSLECDPEPKPDAGHIQGSGINPTFSTKEKPITCGKSGSCEIQLTIEEISKL